MPCAGPRDRGFGRVGDTEPVTEALNRRLLDVLSSLGDELVERVDADACAISRVIGDVLILIVERVPEGWSSLQSGQGYLVSDYPLTAEVLGTRRPQGLTLDDPDVDEAEATILREQGFGGLVMAPLELNGAVWGLVEVYRIDRRPFSAADIELVHELSRLT
jgi:GAF domain-containing protein